MLQVVQLFLDIWLETSVLDDLAHRALDIPTYDLTNPSLMKALGDRSHNSSLVITWNTVCHHCCQPWHDLGDVNAKSFK